MRIVKNTLSAFLGTFYSIFILTFLLLSTPVFLFRILIILFAKCIRPDLGDILSGQSAIFAGDYMSETPPRSNVVFTLIFEGQLTVEQVRARVIKNWIETKDKYNFENFQRYPVKWLGFTFWKDASKSFSVDRHVLTYSGKETEITDDQLTEIIESQVNKKTPNLQSPWILHLIENYRNPNVHEQSTEAKKQHCVLIFQFHHCLLDGTGAMTVLVEGLFEQRWKRQSPAPLPKMSAWQNVLSTLTAPISFVTTLSWFMSHSFRRDPFKISDSRKEWHQVCAKSGPIPIEHLKKIKNAFQVNYTSVLLTAMSAAVYKTLGDVHAQEKDSMLCSSMLLARGITKRKILANHMTAALLDLPCAHFSNPVERLHIVNQRLENSRASSVPMWGQRFTSFLGAQTYAVNSFLMNNKMIPIGLTNLAGVPANIQLNENTKWVHTKYTVGGFSGNLGVNITTISHGKLIEIFVLVERALMTKEEVESFVGHVKVEIEKLKSLIPANPYVEKV